MNAGPAAMHAMLAAAEAHLDWAIGLIEQLVRLESPSTDRGALDRCGRSLASLLTALGLRVTAVDGAGGADHIRAELGQGTDQVLVVGHFDTVWPVGQLERMPLRHDGGFLYGPGAYDMKAGIVTAMLAARVLGGMPASGHRLVMLWTSDEEVGSGRSRAAIEHEARRSRAVLVLEPALAGGGVKTARKGVGEYTITARGAAAHAGVEPERGASAVHELAWQVTRLLQLEDRARGLTVNVGRFTGGTRPNVVAAEAAIEVDVRIPAISDADRVAAAIASLTPRDPRVQLTVAGGVNRPPMERTAGVEALYQRARRLAASVGRDLPEGATGGASDGNFTAALGVPTLDGLGPDGAGAHALDERIDLHTVAFRAALVAALARELP